MENQLRQNVIQITTDYCTATKATVSMVSGMAARDSGFISRIKAGDRTFTIRKYDEVIQWFSDHWPKDIDWPEAIKRPEKVAA